MGSVAVAAGRTRRCRRGVCVRCRPSGVGDLFAAQARQSAASNEVGLTYWFSWYAGGSAPGGYCATYPTAVRAVRRRASRRDIHRRAHSTRLETGARDAPAGSRDLDRHCGRRHQSVERPNSVRCRLCRCDRNAHRGPRASSAVGHSGAAALTVRCRRVGRAAAPRAGRRVRGPAVPQSGDRLDRCLGSVAMRLNVITIAFALLGRRAFPDQAMVACASPRGFPRDTRPSRPVSVVVLVSLAVCPSSRPCPEQLRVQLERMTGSAFRRGDSSRERDAQS